jgi:hypothetical protein
MSAIKIGSTLAAVLFALGFLLTGRAQAEDISGSLSGTAVAVSFDFDKDSSTLNSAQFTGAGEQNVGGEFSAQAIIEADPTPGKGCSRAPTTQAGCSIDGVTNGCLYNLTGGVGALRFNSNGDISSFQVTGGTQCEDFNSSKGFAPPYDFTLSADTAWTGGSGEFAGATGNGTVTGSGRILATDLAGHAFSWLQATYTATLTMP